MYTVNRKKHQNVYVISSTKPDLSKCVVQKYKRFPHGLNNVSTPVCET